MPKKKLVDTWKTAEDLADEDEQSQPEKPDKWAKLHARLNREYKSPMLVIMQAYQANPEATASVFAKRTENQETEKVFEVFLGKAPAVVIDRFVSTPLFVQILKQSQAMKALVSNPNLSDASALQAFLALDKAIGKRPSQRYLDFAMPECRRRLSDIKDLAVLNVLLDYPKAYTSVVWNKTAPFSLKHKVLQRAIVLYRQKKILREEFRILISNMAGSMNRRQLLDLFLGDIKLTKAVISNYWSQVPAPVLIDLWAKLGKQIAEEVIHARALPKNILEEAWTILENKKPSITILNCIAAHPAADAILLRKLWEKSKRNTEIMTACLKNDNCSKDLAADMLLYSYEPNNRYYGDWDFRKRLGDKTYENMTKTLTAAKMLSSEE